MRAAAAAGLAAQPVAFADPHVADADGGADHADPDADDAHDTDSQHDASHADPDADRTDIGTGHDQPVTDNDGQRHHGHPDSSSEFSRDAVGPAPGADPHADVQPRRHADQATTPTSPS